MGREGTPIPRPVAAAYRCAACGARFHPDRNPHRTATRSHLGGTGFWVFFTEIRHADLCNECIRHRRHRRRRLHPEFLPKP